MPVTLFPALLTAEFEQMYISSSVCIFVIIVIPLPDLTGSGRSSNYAGKTGSPNPGLSSCSDYLRETVLGMSSKKHYRGSTMDGKLCYGSHRCVPRYLQ